MTDEIEICNIIEPILKNKQNRALNNNPPPRLNIVSPYPINSSFQLNMRRKVEILKYASSQQNTKTNNLTEKQQFANLAKNINTISQYQINNSYSNLVCEEDKIKPTISTSCDVPGPPIILQYEPTVPLYNYTNRDRSSAITNIMTISKMNDFE